MQDAPPTTFLFTDIEGSTRLWEQDAERMRRALAAHDGIARNAVEQHGGLVVKMTGDGVHAAFDDPVAAVRATVALLRGLADANVDGLELQVRCGMHLGAKESRDNDFFGTTVNRAARIMSAAHGGQVLASRAVVEWIGDRMPDGCAWRDLGSVRLRDLTAPERLYQLRHPALRETFPALRSLESTPNNLPRQLTSFVGRERELREAQALLAGTRLLTLTGVGGLGKTRLSLQLAASVLDAWPDGVWFVELAALRAPELVAQAVASVLGVKAVAGERLTAALESFVRDRQLLIVLDNCEHLIEPCAALAKALLAAGPSTAILASSREPLHVAGETTFALPALATPAATTDESAATIGASEAVRLFADRATAARPAFRMTDANAGVVADICRRLDGIPLALELAAARVRALSLDDIAKRLVDRFALLKSRDTTLLPRQQTLRALVDWSYDLLDDDERALFRALSVFAGGWTLDAAEAVGAPARSRADADVADLLARLAEKSLVLHDGDGRYRLLDTLRQYGSEKLEEAGEAAGVQALHLAYYLALAERARPELYGPEQGAWLARLDVERENLLAAHAAADHVPDGAALGLRLVSAVRYYWINRGLLRLGRQVTVEALQRPGAQGRDLARCRGLFDAGQLDVCMGNYREGRHWLEESLALARELGVEALANVALHPLCIAALGEGDLAVARRYADEALAIARRHDDQGRLAAALNAVAQLHRVAGELDLAEPLYAQFVAIAQALGDRESVAIGLLNQAIVAVARNDAAGARTLLASVLAIVDETGSRQLAQCLLEVVAGVAALAAEWRRVGILYGAAQAQMRQTGIQRDPADAAALAPHVNEARRALGAEPFAAAVREGEQRTREAAMDDVRAYLAPSA